MSAGERLLRRPTGGECNGKTRYREPADAKRAAQTIQHHTKVRMRAYHCHDCKGWHLTSLIEDLGRSRRQLREVS